MATVIIQIKRDLNSYKFIMLQKVKKLYHGWWLVIEKGFLHMLSSRFIDILLLQIVSVASKDAPMLTHICGSNDFDVLMVMVMMCLWL